MFFESSFSLPPEPFIYEILPSPHPSLPVFPLCPLPPTLSLFSLLPTAESHRVVLALVGQSQTTLKLFRRGSQEVYIRLSYSLFVLLLSYLFPFNRSVLFTKPLLALIFSSLLRPFSTILTLDFRRQGSCDSRP